MKQTRARIKVPARIIGDRCLRDSLDSNEAEDEGLAEAGEEAKKAINVLQHLSLSPTRRQGHEGTYSTFGERPHWTNFWVSLESPLREGQGWDC